MPPSSQDILKMGHKKQTWIDNVETDVWTTLTYIEEFSRQDVFTSRAVVTPTFVEQVPTADSLSARGIVTPNFVEVQPSFADAALISSVVSPNYSEVAGLVDLMALRVLVEFLGSEQRVIVTESWVALVDITAQLDEPAEKLDTWQVNVKVRAVFVEPIAADFDIIGLLYRKWYAKLEPRMYEAISYRKWAARVLVG